MRLEMRRDSRREPGSRAERLSLRSAAEPVGNAADRQKTRARLAPLAFLPAGPWTVINVFAPEVGLVVTLRRRVDLFTGQHVQIGRPFGREGYPPSRPTGSNTCDRCLMQFMCQSRQRQRQFLQPNYAAYARCVLSLCRLRICALSIAGHEGLTSGPRWVRSWRARGHACKLYKPWAMATAIPAGITACLIVLAVIA